MAERTISIYPISKAITLEQIQQEFAQYSIQKIGLVVQKSTGYIQFANANQIEALSIKYPQCKVTNLNQAEIGLVQPQFKWPVSKTTAKAQTLVLIKNCEKILQIPQEKIRQIFKQFGIERIVKFDNTKEIVLQFYSQDELQLLELNFDDLKVPQLGPNAQIDVDSQFPVERFIQKYLELNQVRVVQHSQKKEVKPIASPIKEKVEAPLLSQEKKIDNYLKSKEEEKMRKEEQNRKKMEQIEREIIQREKARQSAIQKFQRERREQEEKSRIQRELKQKKEKQRQQRQRKQRQARQLKEKEQRQKREQEDKQKSQLKLKQEREKAEQLRLKKQIEDKKLQQERQKRQLQQRLKQQAQSQQKQRKQEQRKMQEQLQKKILIEKIENVKREVKLEEKKFARQQLLPEKVQQERELEQILAQQKQRMNKKQINLPQIIKTNSQSNKQKESNILPQKTQYNQQQFTKVKKPLTVGNYRDISLHFVTVIAIAWLYYLWIS